MRWAMLCWVMAFGAACNSTPRVSIEHVSFARGQISTLWQAEEDTGWWPSLRVDADDQIHLSFCDVGPGDLRYASRRPGENWRHSAVASEGAVGKYTSLALRADGRPAIAYYDQSKQYLKLAEQQPGGAWTSEAIAFGLEVGMGAALRFDAAENPQLFYYTSTGKLMHAQRREGRWTRTVLADAVGGYSVRISPVLQPNGYWLSFVDWNMRETRLHLLQQQGDNIEIATLAHRDGPGWRSVLLDTAGQRPAVLYSSGFKGRLMLAEPESGGLGWKHRIVHPAAGNFAATQAPNGDWLVAYEDIDGTRQGRGTVALLRRSAKGERRWQRTALDLEAPAGDYLDIAANSRSEALVVYHAEAVRGLKVYDETGQVPEMTSRREAAK